MADNTSTLGKTFGNITGGGASKESNKLLQSINRKLANDPLDSAKATYKIDRQIDNRIADIQAEQDAKVARGEAKSRDVRNVFDEDEITKGLVSSLKDVMDNSHNATRQELDVNIQRIKVMMDKVAEEGLEEGEFLTTQMGKSLKVLEKEHQAKSALSARAANKVAELSEQYLDVQGLAAAFTDNNPVMMGLYKLGADAIKGHREKKANQAKMLAEDARRRDAAQAREEDKAKDEAKILARKKLVQDAEEKAAKEKVKQAKESGKAGPREDVPLPNATQNVKAGPREDTPLPFEKEGGGDAMSMFGDGFAFPEDEYSNTGDAAEGISPLQMEALAQATGGAISSFTRIEEDDDDYAQAREMLKQSNDAIEVVKTQVDNMQTLDTQVGTPELSTQDALETKLAESFTKANNAEEERESDEFMAETVQWQEKVIEKFDKLIGSVDKQEKMFTKLNKTVADSGDTILDDAMDLAGMGAAGVAGVAGGGILAKLGGLVKKVPGGKGLIKAGGAVAGAAGLGKMFSKAGPDVAETMAKSAGDDVAKAGGKAAGKSAAKTAGKGIGKSLLKKIPLLGLIAGAGFAVGRLMEGDVEGAGLEIASGAASLLPGIGTAASVAIDAGLLARDMSAVDGSKSSTQEPIAYSAAGNALYKGDDLNQPLLLDKTGKAWTYASSGPPVSSGKVGRITEKSLASNKPTRNPVEMLERSYMDKVVHGRGSEQAFGIGSGTDRLLQEISEGEGTSDSLARLKGFDSGYDVPYGHGQFGRPDEALSSMTIKEIKEFQKEQIRATKGTIPGTSQGTGAVGKYQVTQTTLAELQEQLGFSDNDVFDKNLQDRLGKALLDKRGYEKFQRGEMSDKDFQSGLAKEWASVANPDTGRSHYGQATGTSTDEIQGALQQAKLEHSMERQTIIQTAQLEKGVGEYVLRANQNNIPDVQTVAPPSKPQQIAKQSGTDSLRGNEVTGISARNSDSTLQRVTDRWISRSFA
jgi:hypothetical protein